MISKAQKEQFLDSGYLLLEQALPPQLLEQLRTLADTLEANALAADAGNERLHGACVVHDNIGPTLIRYDDILGVDKDATLDLLACPAMMAVAKQLSGPGTVPLQVDILYKQQYPRSSVIPWHQGAQHPRNYPYLNIGIYLDDAPAGDGCLRYVPGTQHELQDIDALSKQYGWEPPGVVEVPAKAGDILIQDMMVLHGSQPKKLPGVRRTIYVELRPYEGILESGFQSQQWAKIRQKWMNMVLQRAQDPDYPLQDVEGYVQGEPLNEDAIVQEVITQHEPPIPAVYCKFIVDGDDYPIPRELKAEVNYLHSFFRAY